MIKKLLCFLLFLGYITIGHADTYPATLVVSNNSSYTDAASWCQSVLPAATSTTTYTFNRMQMSGTYGIQCYGNATNISSGTTNVILYTTGTMGYKCVNGGTLSGSTCTKSCDEGQALQTDGTCTAPNTCQENAGNKTSDGLWDFGTNSSTEYAQNNLLACDSGCRAGFRGNCYTHTLVKNGVTHYLCTGYYTYLGTQCKESDPVIASPSDDTESCASGQGMAKMNGKTICIDDEGNPVDTDKNSNDGTSTSDSSTTKTNGDGTTTTDNGSTTTCTGGTCTTTKTTTTTNPDGTSSTETETTTESQDDFCASNPTNELCEEADPCDEDPTLLSCLKTGEPESQDDIKTDTKQISSISAAMSTSGSCPASVSLPHGAEFSYEPMCDFAIGIRPVVLALCWIAAFGIVVYYFRS